MARRRQSLSEAVHGAAKPAGGSAPDSVPDQGATKGLLLRLPSELHRRLRQLALDEETSMQALGLEALEQILQERQERRQ